METNDFLGSFAQENVSFTTQIVRTASVGDNFWTVLIFVENDRFVQATAENGWEDCPGLPTCKVIAVDAETYGDVTSGLLASWLYDLFANGFTGNCILAAPASSSAADVDVYTAVTPAGTEDPSVEGWYEYDGSTYTLTADTTVIEGKTYYEKSARPGFEVAMEEAYEILKPYAYHKTVCAGGNDAVTPSFAVALAAKCKQDEYMSSAPLLPVTDSNLSADPLYSALKAAGEDAFMGWHSDSTRNLALYSLGLALAVTNSSGTSVGNGMDMTASSNITPSNGGVNPTTAQKNVLKAAYIQYMKTVGDNSGSVAAETDKTINGKVYAAYWILAYITYMTKVQIAQLLTQRNFYRNASNYDRILAILKANLSLFDGAGLSEIVLSAPAYSALPDADEDTIIIPNAWSASYVNHLRQVRITGNLYIGS
jgi:hypothetical protein